MKLTKQTNKIKSRIVSVLAIIALVLCTVLSFVLILPSGVPLAESGDAITARRRANGIKFVQVAAGEDFAIGLTYDGKLYGWSLKKDDDRITDLASNNATLGDYYTTVPQEMNVTFRMGPKNANTPSAYSWNATGENEHYHSERTDDSIKSIAATRKTAAFITKLGYIYTWGKDVPYDVDHNESGQDHHLLLRSVTETDRIKCSWTIPYIIDYYYFGTTGSANISNAARLPLEQCIPTNSDGFTSLAGGEYNYAFLFTKNYSGSQAFGQSGDYYHTYIWGSMLYNAANTEVTASRSYSYGGRITGGTGTSDARKIFNTRISQSTTGVSIAAGGYTVAVNGSSTKTVTDNSVYGTSLQLRGRNFITTQNVTPDTDNSNQYAVQNTTRVLSGNDDGIANTAGNDNVVTNDYGRSTVDITSGSITVKNAIAGGNGTTSADGSLWGREVEQYYARQKATINLAYSITNESQKLINSYGTGSEREIDGLTATRYAVSLGNDIGYGISGGSLYAWGDNANDQLQFYDGSVPSTVTLESNDYSDLPVQILSDKGATFISVAAGKQLSQSKAFSMGVTTLSGNSFSTAVQNEDKYISAALTSSGTVYAWSKDIAATELYFENIGNTAEDVNKKESFIAIYSGYGENLFAITASGKLVRITVETSGTGEQKVSKFAQYTYDTFNDASGKEIDNWTVNSSNRVVFTVPTIADDATTAQKISPDLGSATFYVWSAAQSDGALELDNRTIQINGNNSETPYNALVSSNNIGDAYRIIGFNVKDKEIEYLKSTRLLGVDDTKNDYYAPRYYFDGKLMSEAQRKNMFDANVVNGSNGEGIGIYIKPKQSSKGKDITVKFYIARYNYYSRYNGTTDNAIYYDRKECTITFAIADTPTVLTFDAHDPTSLNSNIPLLDPNNPNNTNYSLAVQNVSLGVDKLIQFLTGQESVNTNFRDAIIAVMNAKDSGFPSKAKIAAGDLSYYLTAADQGKYNDVYQYLFADRDSDRVALERLGSGGNLDPIISEQTKGVDGYFRTIEVKIPLVDEEKGYGLKTDFSSKSAADIAKAIKTDFDNVYGLYNFAVDNDKNLTFYYDVVMFTATDAIGNVVYKNNSDDARVNDYTTARGGARASFYAKTLIEYSFDEDKGYVDGSKYSERERYNNIAYVYSQPTLRLKSNLEGAGKVVDVNGSVDGTKNKYTYNYPKALYVGDSVTIKLDDFVSHIRTANISFAYEHSSSTESLNTFSKNFTDFTGQNMTVFSLTADSFTLSPTTAAPINFTIAVQRFARDDKTVYFTSENKVDGKTVEDEVIYLTFNFNEIIGFKLNKYTGLQTSYLITDTTSIDLFVDSGSTAANKTSLISIMGDNNSQLLNNSAAGAAYASITKNAKINKDGLRSSETNKLEAERLFSCVASDTKITITPLRSGTGTILFSVNSYDKTESFMFTINVSSKTEMAGLTIIDTYSIPIADINKALVESNKFNSDVVDGNYKILYNDVKNPEVANNNEKQFNAVYFTSEAGDGYPPFIENVVFEKLTTTEPTMRIIPSNSTVVKNDTYYMHIKFVNTAGENYTSYENVPAKSIIEVVIPVVSGKIKLQSKAGGDLVANIDCRHAQTEDNKWWTKTGEKLETKATIPLSYLLSCTNTEGPESYKIFLVSADSEAAKYFQYNTEDDLSIIITPKDNTPKNYEISVSAYEGSTTIVLTFEVSVSGILTTLPVMTNDDGIIGYGNIWLYSFAIVFGVLLIIFVVRFIIYMRKRAKQRAIIKRNQDLIRLRDRMHGKATAATRDQLVKAKLKMENPKYAKAFNDMRKDKEEESGVTLENSDLAVTAEKKTNKKKKKKGGKKTVAELKAELAAKKAAFAAAQAGNAQPVNPFATDIPMDGGFVPPDAGFGAQPDAGFVAPDDGGFVTPDAGFATPDIDGSEIIFDASDIGDGNM